MSEIKLNDLESQVDHLITLLKQLKLENQALYKKIANISNENVSLLSKKTTMIQAIRKLITKLQDELLCQTQK